MHKMQRFAADARNYYFSNNVPLLYYSKVENVGDLASVYIVERMTGRTVSKAQTRFFPHLSAVGSTIGVSGRNTYIWGSGSIDGRASKKIDFKKIFALRGKRTFEILGGEDNIRKNIPLGDPAILLPEFYAGKCSKTHKVGIVPHFDELEILSKFLFGRDDIKIVSVHQCPENFVDDLLSCEYILSSSLHGLILADAYHVPNLWISSSDRLLGGKWKFLDYYSCTDRQDMTPIKVESCESLLAASDVVRTSGAVSSYSGSRRDLIDCFPFSFVN